MPCYEVVLDGFSVKFFCLTLFFFSQSSDREPSRGPKRENEAKLLATGFRLMALAFEFVGLIGIFGYVGFKTDEKYGDEPWGILVGLLVGLTLGLTTMIKQLEKFNR